MSESEPLPGGPDEMADQPASWQVHDVERIWDGLLTRGHEPGLTDEQKAEIDRRLADDDAAPDDVVPWEDVLFYQHTRAAAFIRQTLHRYSAFPFVQRTLSFADLMIGAALWNVRQTGLEKQQPVQEKK